MKRVLALLPVILFLALGIFLFVGLNRPHPTDLPSALIGKPVPEFDLPGIEGGTVPGLARSDLVAGQVSVVNFWASWCGPCRDEHPVLVDLAGRFDGQLVGINYKDDAENANRFLAHLGNPFARVGADTSGRVGIDWGLYGVPETYVVSGKGEIVYKHVGPLTPEAVERDLLPAIATAQQR